MKPTDLIQQNEVGRTKNIGKNIRTYRECSNIPLNIFAERCKIPVDVLENIENGTYAIKRLWTVLRISEELKIGLSDLFETDSGKYYTMFKDEKAIEYILLIRKNELGFSDKALLEKLDIKNSAFHNWRTHRHVPHPFVLQNIITLLKVTSRDLKSVCFEEKKQDVSNTTKNENQNSLDVVIKALRTYQKINDCVGKLNDIINLATELRDELGGLK